jgi:CheY-like chemotaxis protein
MILVVDDDPEFLQEAERFLPATERLMFAASSRQAILLLKTLGEHEFSLALVDLNLPNENGFELISTLTKEFPHLPVIAISGFYAADVLESAKLLGAIATLAKPVTREWKDLLQRSAAQRYSG